MIADDQTSIDRTTIFRFDELILPRRSTWTFQPPRVNGRWFVFFFATGKRPRDFAISRPTISRYRDRFHRRTDVRPRY